MRAEAAAPFSMRLWGWCHGAACQLHLDIEQSCALVINPHCEKEVSDPSTTKVSQSNFY